MKKAILIFALVLFPIFVSANPPMELSTKLDRAILHILKDGIPSHNIFPRPAHPAVKDSGMRGELVQAILGASDRYPKIPPMLLLATAFREGSFNPESRGALGAQSQFQIMEQTAKLASKLDPACDPKTIPGSAICAAVWLDQGLKICGTLPGAVAFYVTGATCSPSKSSQVRWIARDRTRLAEYLTRLE